MNYLNGRLEIRLDLKGGEGMSGNRWIDQLDKLYWKIVKDPAIAVERLDKANEIILEAIDKLRPLTK